jgi:DNA-binding LacI/PurR family transcriptional regulator
MNHTMQDVAEKAHVSQSTVSRVFCGDNSISQDTAAKVIEAAHEVGYKPRKSISSRKQNRALVLGFTTSLRKHISGNPTIVDIIHGIELEAKERGFSALIHSLGYDVADSSGTRTIPRELEEGRADGMIILGHPPEELFETLSKRGIPFVAIEAAMGYSQANIVMPDHYTAGYLPTKHLLDLGHRRIAYAGAPSEYFSIYQQTCAYRAAMLEAGIPEDEHLIIKTDMHNFAELQTGQAVAEKVLSMSNRPTGIIFGGEIEAAQALRIFQDHDLAVPADISIIASSSSAMRICQSTQPRLTTVCCINDEFLGRAAVMRLLDILHGSGTSRKEVFPVKLVIQGSTAPPHG